MNEVAIIGRITRNPELRRTQSGTAVVNFHIAVDRDRNKTDFIPCVVWRDQAESLAKYGFKGMMVGISGNIRMDEYEKQGVKVQSLAVEAYSIDYLSRKPAENKAPSFEDITEDDPNLPF